MEQHTEPTQEELDQFFKQCQAENDAEENWWIDQHNGEHQPDPPCCFENSDDYHAQFLSPRQRREQHTASVSIDDLPF